MKNLKWLGWTVIVFLCSGRLSAQSPSPNQLTVPLSSPGKPYTLNVSLLSGAIKVTSYAGKEILIDVIGANQNKNESKNENVDAGNGMKRPHGEGRQKQHQCIQRIFQPIAQT